MTANANVIELTNDNFKNFVDIKSGYFVVDFWAPWCGPCRMMAPVFEELSSNAEFAGIKFGKVNVDDSNEIAATFRVASIPFFVLFKNGQVVSTKVGGCTKNQLSNWIKENAI